MIYYSLPGHGMYGGIKTGAQFVYHLQNAGIPCVLVTPEGLAPQWFDISIPVISEETCFPSLSAADTMIFSLPFDYERLKALPSKLIYHCQGTHPAMIPICQDPDILLFSAWPQAENEMRHISGRETYDTGIAVSDVFFYDGRVKSGKKVAVMPRRGAEWIQACQQAQPEKIYLTIDGAHERETAAIMKESSIYLATSVDEGFGLPALEAMAAGCAVLSVPVRGGMAFLHHGKNASIVPPEQLATEFSQLNSTTAQRYRDYGRVTASQYRMAAQYQKICHLLESRAGEWLCA
ncbi:glycosyltransferase [Kiritimatiellota bacterium B12222]|nr:glycosyltransferase [Kiritimatiellota bacterium B12222]